MSGILFFSPLAQVKNRAVTADNEGAGIREVLSCLKTVMIRFRQAVFIPGADIKRIGLCSIIYITDTISFSIFFSKQEVEIMLKMTTLQEMEKILKKEYPYAAQDAIARRARMYCAKLDQVYDPLLKRYAKDGYMTDLEEGEYSVFYLMSLKNCGYLQAVVMMNEIRNGDQKAIARIKAGVKEHRS